MRPPLVILGNPENRRVEFALRAARALGWREVRVVAWLEFLRDRTALARELRPDGWLRIESPGENFAVEKALLRLGARGAEEEDLDRIPVEGVDALPFRRGEILPTRQWYGGWRATLLRVAWCLAESAGCRVMNPPADIAVMFDKARCHELFAAAGVPAPSLLGQPDSYEHLRETLRAAGCGRVFLKPRHSSSASGVVALEVGRNGAQAFSSVEMAADGRLFNSLTVRRYRDGREVARLVDAVCRQGSIAERWFPKAGYDGRRFDLRVLVIGGRAAHVVMRQSDGPITNLHLGNRRGDLDGLRQRMGDAWQSALTVAESAARVFPQSLYVAVDLLVAPGFRRFAVAEVNAFGDLLPNLLHEGRDTYTAEFAELL